MASKLTVVDTVYFSTLNDDPHEIGSKFARVLRDDDDQPYKRRYSVGSDWTPLDTGWLRACSQLLIKHERPVLERVPSLEDVDAEQSKIVQVAFSHFGDDYWEIHPGESMRGCPSNLGHLCLRCSTGVAKVTVFLVPR